MIKTKRGASEAIVFVLLVGFAVTIAIIVINWSVGHTKELTEAGIDFVEKNIECDKVGMNVKDISAGDCSSLEIINKGYLKISKVITRSPDDNKIEVIPVIILGETNKEIGCKDKSIVLECKFTYGLGSGDINIINHDIDLMPNEKTLSPINPYLIFVSCKAILDAGFSTGDGTYTIDPDGEGSSNPFSVYCDMTTDGGGWTFVLHAVGGSSLSGYATTSSYNLDQSTNLNGNIMESLFY